MHHFFKEDLEADSVLKDEEFQHCAQVLRHQVGDRIVLTDGKGVLSTATIRSISKKSLEFDIEEKRRIERSSYRTHLFISPTKQLERMEWLVEKTAELGVDQVTFLLTQNSERRKLRLDRLQKKVISALKQSKGAHLMQLHDLTEFHTCFDHQDLKVVAYVDDKLPHITNVIGAHKCVSLFIGPEGDFTKEEIEYAQSRGAHCVSLGPSVLRTETAGIVACCAATLLGQSYAAT